MASENDAFINLSNPRARVMASGAVCVMRGTSGNAGACAEKI